MSESLQMNDSNFEMQCFPNPFSELLSVQYELPANSNVQIKLHNQFGMEVKVIDRYQTKGLYEEVWDVERLTAGIYFISLRSEERTQNLKLLKH